MRTLACMLLIGTLVATTTQAAQVTYDYGWEDGVGTIMGSFGNVVDPTNVTGLQTGQNGNVGPFDCPGANSGTRYLHVAEEPHDGTPQAYVAYIEYLTDGDVVDASFFGFDLTTGNTSPSLRIWAHYALSGDVMSFVTSAGGNNTYTSGIGWESVGWSWTFDSAGGTRDALVIEARLYSSPTTGDYRTDYFIDDVSVTAPDTATVTFAPEPASLVLLSLAGLLIRRR